MSRYETEEEQIEAFKSWWNKYGTQLLSAVLVVVLAFSGWRYWNNSQYVENANASSMYEFLQVNLQQGSFGEVSREALKLMQEQPSSPYAAGAAMLQATYNLEKGEVDEAVEHLKWILVNSEDKALKTVAHMRLARILSDNGQMSEAEEQISELQTMQLNGSAQGELDYITGVLALKKQDDEKAFNAFTAVVSNPQTEKNLLGLAQIQLDDLAK